MGWPWQNKREVWEKNREVYYRLADVVLVLNIEGKVVGVLKSSPRHPVSEALKGHYLRELLGPEQGLKGAQAMREAIGADRRSTYEYSLKVHAPEGASDKNSTAKNMAGERKENATGPNVISYNFGREGEEKPKEEVYYFQAQIVPIPREFRGREERVLWLATDCTERKQREASLWMKNALLEGALRARIGLTSDTGEHQEALDEALKVIGLATNADRVYILEHYQTPYYQVLSLQREWCGKGIPSQLGNPHLEQIEIEELSPGWLGGLLKSGYKSLDLDQAPENLSGVLRVAPTQKILAIPVFRENILWGVLGIEFHKERRDWEDEEIAILKVLTDSIGGWVNSLETRKELKVAKIEAEKANRAKGEFLAVISHELRTPMNAILGYSQLLKSSIADKEQKEQVSFIERSGRALLDLINNILDFSKIESNGVELEVIPFSMEQVVIETLENCMIKAKEKGIALDYTLDKDMPKQLLGDPYRLKQVLLNLVNNAVKFTGKGGVQVMVNQQPLDAKVLLHCAVKDTGIGIEPSKASRLFRAFSQADSSTTRQYGGTGLGLAIAKRLVESMGGKIWVESAVNEGSVFHFTLQLAIAAEVVSHSKALANMPANKKSQNNLTNEGNRRDNNTEESGGEGAKNEEQDKKKAEMSSFINNDLDMTFAQRFPLRILLVEDDPMNQRLAVKLLDRLGYSKVDIAFDGMEGLKRINEKDYELVLADLQMPRLDGIGMTRRLRMGECGAAKRKLPVAALTAYAMSEDRERCLDAGMTDFLRKPIQISELKEALITAYHQRVVK